MKSSPPGDVLRGVALHSQPVPLLRPLAGRGAPATHIPVAASERTDSPDPVAEAIRAGYAEGLARGREDGRRAGYADGSQDADLRIAAAVRAAGEAATLEAQRRQDEAQAAIDAAVLRMDAARLAFEAAATTRLQALESDTVALAFEAVCRLVGEREEGADRVVGAVRAAMQPLRAGTLLRVRLHPDDLRLLRGSGTGQALQAGAGAVEWIGDPAVESGGCLLDTRRGSVDARMETQLLRLRKLWAGLVDDEGDGPADAEAAR